MSDACCLPAESKRKITPRVFSERALICFRFDFSFQSLLFMYTHTHTHTAGWLRARAAAETHAGLFSLSCTPPTLNSLFIISSAEHIINVPRESPSSSFLLCVCFWYTSLIPAHSLPEHIFSSRKYSVSAACGGVLMTMGFFPRGTEQERIRKRRE